MYPLLRIICPYHFLIICGVVTYIHFFAVLALIFKYVFLNVIEFAFLFINSPLWQLLSRTKFWRLTLFFYLYLHRQMVNIQLYKIG